MKLDLNTIDLDNFCNDTQERHHDQEMYVTIDGQELTINVDVDIKYDIHVEDDYGYKKSVVREVFVLFNGCWDKDSNDVELTSNQISEIEKQIEMDIKFN